MYTKQTSELEIVPVLFVNKAKKAVKFYEEAFGAKLVEEFPEEGGDDPEKLSHANIVVMGKAIFLADPPAGDKTWSAPDPKAIVSNSKVALRFKDEDCESMDKFFERAVKAGATVEIPLMDCFWGDRYGTLCCPFGHRFTFLCHLTEERAKAAMEAHQKKQAEEEPESDRTKEEEPALKKPKTEKSTDQTPDTVDTNNVEVTD